MLEILIQTGGTASANKINLDLTGEEIFEINYSISEINDITNSNGAYTKSLTLPGSAKNRAAFGFITDLSTNLGFDSNSYSPNAKFPVWVLENTIPILTGYITVTGFEYSDTNNDVLINVTIYGDNSSFYQSLRSDLVTDLDFSEYNFTYNENAMRQSWTNSVDAYRNGVYFNLQDNGNGWVLNDINGNPDLGTTASILGTNILKVSDFRPGIYVKTIWDKIFQAHNFTYNSRFLNGPTGPDHRFGNLIIPYNQPTFNNGSTFANDKIFNVGYHQPYFNQKTVAIHASYSPGTYLPIGTASFYGITYGLHLPYEAQVTAFGNATSITVSSKINRVFTYAETTGTASGTASIRRMPLPNVWYTGYMMCPVWQTGSGSSIRNTFAPLTTYTMSKSIPFNLESPAPILFNTGEITLSVATTSVYTVETNDSWVFNTVDITDEQYSDTIYANIDGRFKQRFVLRTDIVTNYSIGRQPLGTDHIDDYKIWFNFYREFQINGYNLTTDTYTYSISPSWASGTGSWIPCDLGGFPRRSPHYTGTGSWIYGNTASEDHYRFWVCDGNFSSNVFDAYGQLIVPQGTPDANRYLGKFCTDPLGYCYINAPSSPDGTGEPLSDFYDLVSGNCISYFWNDGKNDTMAGFVATGVGEATIASDRATEQAFMGDWYQQLVMPTIYLDGNKYDPYFGTTTSAFVQFGNVPIFPNERVRCVCNVTTYQSGSVQGVMEWSYLPPVSVTLLSYTNFQGFRETNHPLSEAQAIRATMSYYNSPEFNYNFPAELDNPKYKGPLTRIYNEVSLNVIEGQDITLNNVIPKNMTQRDFVSSIVKMHNLYIEPSKDNKNNLIIEPREDYYALESSTLDWTSKLDLTAPIKVQVLSDNANRRNIFKFKSDTDWYNKQYTQLSQQVYGQYVYVFDNEFLSGDKNIEVIFSPTPMVQIYPSSSTGVILNATGSFIIPSLVSGSNIKPENASDIANGSVQTNFRILYKNYISNENRETINIFNENTRMYPYAGPYDNPYNPSYAVNFGQTIGNEGNGEFFAQEENLSYDTLVTSFWKGLLNEMNDINGKKVTVQMFLRPNDINNFTFNKLVFLTINNVDSYYKVDSIKGYIPGKNSTCTVTLIKVNNLINNTVQVGAFSSGTQSQ